MPHDKHGRSIEVGDAVRVRVWENDAYVEKNGIVRHVTPGSTSCNLEAIVSLTRPQAVTITATASECELVAKADGSLID